MFNLKISVVLPADPDTVFQALTKAGTIRKWSGQAGKVQAKIGGKFELFDGWVKGHVLAYSPGKTFIHTWLPTDWPEGTQASIVQYAIVRSGKNTKVTLSHKGLPSKRECESHKQGWYEHVFDPLKTYLLSKK